MSVFRIAVHLGAKKHEKMGFSAFESFCQSITPDSTILEGTSQQGKTVDVVGITDLLASGDESGLLSMAPDVILLKVTDEIATVEQKKLEDDLLRGNAHRLDDFAHQEARQIVLTASRLPEIFRSEKCPVIIDPVECQELTMDRRRFGEAVSDVCKSLQRQGFSAVLEARQVELNLPQQSAGNSSSARVLLAESSVKFPVICKSLEACGSAESHMMSIVFSVEQLVEVLAEPGKSHLLIQEFHNHGGVIFKVFCMGEYFHVVKRKSLPDMPAATLDISTGNNPQRLNFDSQDQSPFAAVASLHTAAAAADAAVTSAALPSHEVLAPIVRELGSRLKMRLFGFDAIVDSLTKQLVIIDVNYFPNYIGIPEFNKRFLRFFASCCSNSDSL